MVEKGIAKTKDGRKAKGGRVNREGKNRLLLSSTVGAVIVSCSHISGMSESCDVAGILLE